MTRDGLFKKLYDNGIVARRYFYPLCSSFPTYRGLPSATRANLPVAAETAENVLCLPLYAALAAEEQDRVIELIRG